MTRAERSKVIEVTAKEQSPTPPFNFTRLISPLIVLVSGIVYIPALTGSPIWDDNLLLYGRGFPLAHNLKECFTVPLIGTTYFRPIVAISFLWDRVLFGGVPIHSHLVNVILHMAGAGCLICLLRLAFSSNPIALLGGFLFGGQPAQVMTVAWIGGRTDSLCALWFILFAWALISSAKASGRKRTVLQACAIIAYTLAVFTREQAALSMLLVPPAYLWFSADRRAQWRQVVPYVLVAAFYVAFWLSVQTPDPASSRSIPEMARYFGRTMAYYFLLVAAPAPRWMHTFTLDTLNGFGIWSVLLGFLCAGLLLWLVLSYRRYPAAAWFALAAFLLLLPVLNLVRAPVFLVTPYRADTAGACVAAILAWGIVRAPVHFLARGFFVAALCAYYFGMTWWDSHQWTDVENFELNVSHYDTHI